MPHVPPKPAGPQPEPQPGLQAGHALIVIHGELRELVRRRGLRLARSATERLESGPAQSPEAPLEISYPVRRRASVKDVIEALGPPHTEVGRILASSDGQPPEDIDFQRLLEFGQTLDILPNPVPLDVTRPSLLRPQPLPAPAFAVDVNVAKLARLLRMLGIDAVTAGNTDDDELANIAKNRQRIVLTRDRALLRRNAVAFGRLVRAANPLDQLAETIAHFGLAPPYRTFTRCLDCNSRLEHVDKADIIHRLLPLTKKHFHSFKICPSCQKIYWQGSHHQHMLTVLRGRGLPV